MAKDETIGIDDADQWTDFRLDWLFDPDRQFDHLPIEDQVKMFKARDLRPGKTFNYAVKMFGPAGRRTRQIIAPSMSEMLLTQSESFDLPRRPTEVAKSCDVYRDTRTAANEDGATSKYNIWLEERRKLRHDLDSVAVSSDWLAKKPNKTEMEERVLKKLLDDKMAAMNRQMASGQLVSCMICVVVLVHCNLKTFSIF